MQGLRAVLHSFLKTRERDNIVSRGVITTAHLLLTLTKASMHEVED
jgi:hypothetical protein